MLLTKGAARVYAIDVGTNQLAWKLRSDERVIVHEQTNARDLTAAIVPEPVDIIVCDASFIGLAKVLDAALDLARPGAMLAAARSAKVGWYAIPRSMPASATRPRHGYNRAAGA